MARVVAPLLSAEARGKVSGVIYNTWRGARYAKTFTSPAQPRYERQLTLRNRTINVVRSWQDLSDLQRAAWSQYAVEHPEIDFTGSPKRLTGLNWYTRLNTRLTDMGESTLTEPPSIPAPDAIAGLTATGGSGQISLSWTPPSGTDISIDVWLDGPRSPGRLGKLTKARHRIYAPAETSPLVISSLNPGAYTVYARAIDETTGLSSTWSSDTATVT